MEIIGITGSKGKSSLCYILSSYLKHIGKKVVTYSSIEIDSPLSNKTPHQPLEIVLKNKKIVDDAVKEAASYDADFLILEINEEIIDEEIIDDIPFSYRVVTNIKKLGIEVDNEKCKEKIISFLRQKSKVEDKVFLSLKSNITNEELEELISTLDKEVIISSSKFLCEKRGYSKDKINYLMVPTLDKKLKDVCGLHFSILYQEKKVDIDTNLMFAYNMYNVLEAFSIIDDLKLLDIEAFKGFIKEINIPGRSEIIRINYRYIMVSPTLSPELEELKSLKDNKEINNILLVTASIGQGFFTWEEKYNSKEQRKRLSKTRKFAMEYASNYADYIYLTSSDPANTDPYEIAEEMKSYIKDVGNEIEIDRYEAIKKAIINSSYNDFIIISGRGNRNIYCAKDKMLRFTDLELVTRALHEIGWIYEHK